MGLFSIVRKHDPGGSAVLPMIDGVRGSAMWYGKHHEYRIMLTREWGKPAQKEDEWLPFALFIGMNPSTASEVFDDPTIRREMYITSNGLRLRSYRKVNVSAYRCTNPNRIPRNAELHIGHNFDVILRWALRAQIVIVTCGNLPPPLVDIGRALVEQLQSFNLTLYCLGTNKNGSPKHPLYLSKKPQIIQWAGWPEDEE